MASKRPLVDIKSNWKRRCKRVMVTVGKMFEDTYYGRRPDMFDLLDHVEVIYKLGMHGVELNTKLVEADFGIRARADVCKILRRLEVTSKHLREVAEKFGMPMEGTLQFVNPLLNQLADPVSDFEAMMTTEDKGGE